MESQTKQIQMFLDQGKTLTSMEALTKFRCFRLASRINDLKKAGYPVAKRMIEIDSGKKVAQYFKETSNEQMEKTTA